MNLPIAERELRVAARSPRIYRGRMASGIIFGAITLWMLWVSRQVFSKQAVEMAFGFVSTIALMMCVFSANATSDSISAEKRGGTLGFLFLTDLKGADVVLGKLAASGLMAIYSLLAIIPMLAVPVIMGGISGASVFRTTVTLLNSLFFALCLGLWISARSWEQKKAANAAVWCGISMLWILPGLAELIDQRYGWRTVAMGVRLFTPSYQMQKAGPLGFGMMRDYYWWSVAIVHGMAWLALWRACRIVPDQWQDKPAPAMKRWRDRWNELRMGSSQTRNLFRRKLMAMNPVHWLSSRDRFGPMGNWLLLALLLVFWVGSWVWIKTVSRGNGPPFWGIGIPLAFLATVLLRVKTASLAADLLARDRLSGALELLLSTSLSLKEVSRGIWMTVRRFVLGPAITTMVTGLVIFLCALEYLSSNSNGSEMEAAYLMFFGLSVLFVTDLIAAVWTGLWTSCLTRTPNGGGGMAMLRLLLLPWILFFVTVSLLSYFGVRGFFQEFRNVFLLWFAFCFFNNIFWIKHSRRKFFEEIRTAASERFVREEPSWWQFWRKRTPSGG